MFKEFLQNADDARAERFAVLYDSCDGDAKSDDNSPLPDPAMKDWQGPALYVFNSGVFTDRDFKSVISIGRSGKRNDSRSIGKYGLGFNTAYHFTDVPMFVSANQFVCFDPHTTFLPNKAPGIRCDTKTLSQYPDLFARFSQYAELFTGAPLEAGGSMQGALVQ